ncbi:MAG TPA: class I SAM-dependent methyltransferase [Polyangiaceae bacterium]|nr:class I SAM-dependent methyltransferase [Polyangiaceae bacterium]
MQSDASALMDEINRAAWQTKASVRTFSRLEGFTDEGERVALDSIAREVRDQSLLDLGVGAGRTVPLLRALSADYTAIDYTPELVIACRERYPGARVLHGDARDLSSFPAETFKLVVFSFNGIDAVNTDDRRKVLREVHRVLQRGGVFLFSAHNKRGPGCGERLSFGVGKTRNPVKLLARTLRALIEAPRTARNYFRYSRLNEDQDGRSIMNAAAHNHGLLIQYITLEKQCEELERAGFRPHPEVYENVEGRRVETGDDTCSAWWLHYVARKP